MLSTLDYTQIHPRNKLNITKGGATLSNAHYCAELIEFWSDFCEKANRAKQVPAMAAAYSTQSPSRRQSLTVPQTGDRLKTIEAKVVIIGAQGKSI